MMKLYMDLPSFRTITRNQGKFFFKEIFSAIITEAHSIFCFDKREFLLDEFIMAFLKDNAGHWPQDRRTFNQDIEESVIAMSPINYFESIFIHSKIDNNESYQKYGVIGGNPETIEGVFSKLFLLKTQKNFENTFTIGADFFSWNDLKDTYCPLNDIIIVDPFCLNLEESLLKKNLLALLRLLTKNQKNKINIVIYTLEKEIACGTQKDDVCTNLFSKYLMKHCESIEINTTLIAVGGYDKELIKKFKEHDRIVASNYQSIITGNSHTFINSDGSLLFNTRFLETKSHFKDENQKYFKGIVKDIQEAIDLSYSRNTVKIYGAKKSNYLTF